MGTILNKTMTPKEKAEYILLNYLEVDFKANDWSKKRQLAKQCAIIAVNEIINIYIKFPKHPQYIYWKEVKAEVEKI